MAKTMATNEGVSNCYVFKSRLQEYAQKVGLSTPVYETIKEGPSHEPFFRSTVIVNDVRYDSLPGFFNRKAAEQSAAEVALLELARSGEVNQCISQPVHETGLCKNLLQEYAQKMNYAIPLYQCQKDEAPGRVPLFKCTVEIGGIQYIGASARTKKEAEIKAARTALLAIWSSDSESSDRAIGNSCLTVIPCRKRGVEISNIPEESANAPKAKKSRFKKKMLKKLAGAKINNRQVESTGNLNVTVDNQEALNLDKAGASDGQTVDSGLLAVEAARNCQDAILDTVPREGEISAVSDALACHFASNLENGQPTAVAFNESNHQTPVGEISSFCYGDAAALGKEVNKDVSGVGEVATMMDN